MKMNECTKEFKTTLFDNNETERIKNRGWFSLVLWWKNVG